MTRLTIAGLGVALLVASFCEAQRVDLHRMQERLERVHARLEAGESSRAVASELAAIRTAYARRVERLAAELDRADAAVRDLGLGAVAAERLEKARGAFETNHRALLEGLDRLADSADLSEIEACLRALEPLADAEREDILSAQELPLDRGVGARVHHRLLRPPSPRGVSPAQLHDAG